MAKIKTLKNSEGNSFYPQTHTKGIQKIPLVNKDKMAMYEELAKKYIARRKQLRKDGERYVNYTLLEEIIETPAPSFYTDAETLRCLFYRHMRRKR